MVKHVQFNLRLIMQLLKTFSVFIM